MSLQQYYISWSSWYCMLEYLFYQKTGILPGRKKSLIFNLQSNKTRSGKQIKYQENSGRHMAQMS